MLVLSALAATSLASGDRGDPSAPSADRRSRAYDPCRGDTWVSVPIEPSRRGACRGVRLPSCSEPPCCRLETALRPLACDTGTGGGCSDPPGRRGAYGRGALAGDAAEAAGCRLTGSGGEESSLKSAVGATKGELQQDEPEDMGPAGDIRMCTWRPVVAQSAAWSVVTDMTVRLLPSRVIRAALLPLCRERRVSSRVRSCRDCSCCCCTALYGCRCVAAMCGGARGRCGACAAWAEGARSWGWAEMHSQLQRTACWYGVTWVNGCE